MLLAGRVNDNLKDSDDAELGVGPVCLGAAQQPGRGRAGAGGSLLVAPGLADESRDLATAAAARPTWGAAAGELLEK